MQIDDMNYILIYPETHEHLGLFRDLQDKKNVQLIVTRQREIRNPVIKAIKRINLSWVINKYICLPLKKKWYEKICIDIASNKQYCVIVVDAALRALEVEYLNTLFQMDNVRGVLVLINSMDAQSIGIQEVKPDIKKINWDDIYTFDVNDATHYAFKYLGNCYYSMHSIDEICAQKEPGKTEAYFTGGLKGGREQFILSVFEKLNNAGINADFNIMVTGERRLKSKLYEDIINYYSGSWIPYKKVLVDVINTNVIIEIVQDGQCGPSLRYYEAVCYNKKLLTNNPSIKDLPYYDNRYMKIIQTVEDIDIDWIKAREEVNYHYKGEFSPNYLLETVLY